MSRPDKPKKLGQALAGALPGGVAARLPAPGLLAAWRAAVGPLVASRGRPVRLDPDGALVVAVHGAAFRQELALAAPGLVAALAGLGVRSLKLIKARAAPPPPPPEPEPPPLSAGELAELEAMVAGVRDEKVRQALLAAMSAQFRTGPDRHR
ncbi:DciA family protein [Desulfarculus baarsii]